MVSYNERCFFVFLKELQKAALWKVLEYFALGNEPIHIKGLARKLGISPASAFKDLKILEKSGFLEAQKAGNSLIYSSKDLPLFLEFKRLVFLLYAMPFFEKFLKQNHEVLGLAVFGSIASGSFDKNSDIDLLIEMRTECLPTGYGNPIRRLIAKHFVLPIDVVVQSTDAVDNVVTRIMLYTSSKLGRKRQKP